MKSVEHLLPPELRKLAGQVSTQQLISGLGPAGFNPPKPKPFSAEASRIDLTVAEMDQLRRLVTEYTVRATQRRPNAGLATRPPV